MYLNQKLWVMAQEVMPRIAKGVAMGLCGSVLGILRLLMLGWLISQVINGASLMMLWPYLLLATLLILGFSAWEYLRLVYVHHTAAIVQQQLRLKMFDKMAALGPAYFVHKHSAQFSHAAVEGVELLEVYFGRYLPQFFVAALTPFIIFAIVAQIDLPVASVLLVASLFTLLAPGLFQRWDSRHSMRRSAAYCAFAAEFLDSLQGLVTLKAFGQSKAREASLGKKADELFKSTMWVMATNSLSRGITDIGITLGAVAALALAAYRVESGAMGFEGLILILLLGLEVFKPLRELRSLLHDGMLANAAAEQVFEVLTAQAPMPQRVDVTHLQPNAHWPSAAVVQDRVPSGVQPEIVFDQVSFSYQQKLPLQQWVHRQLSFSVGTGESVAIVGYSGGGKSSIVRLLQRFYAPQQGRILLGGVDVQQMPESQLRDQFSVVSQEMYLFHGTVRENLFLAKENASEEELLAATKAANADTFIRQLPQGYDTVIGERGARLSGGQKQRLAIARALLRNAPILILDEALSSVDAENEILIRNALNVLMKGKTTLILAHRLSSVINCDKILLLHKGSITEQGSHQALMAQQGAYANLMRSQVQSHIRAETHSLTDSALVSPSEDSVVTRLDIESKTRASVETKTCGSIEKNRHENTAPDQKKTDDAEHEILSSAGYGWAPSIALLLRFAKPWWGRLTLTFCLGVARVFSYIAVSLLSAIAVMSLKTAGDYSFWLIVLSITAVAAALLHWFESWLAHDMAFRMLSEMRLALFRKLESLAPAFMVRRRGGDLINLATNDIEMVEYFYAHTMAPIFVAVVVPAAMLGLLGYFHGALALALLPFIVAVAVMPILFRRHLDTVAAKARTLLASVSAFTLESVQGLAELLSFQAVAQRRNTFIRLVEQQKVQRLAFFKAMTKQQVMTDLLTLLASLAVVTCAIPFVTSGLIDPLYLPLLALAAIAAFLPLSEVSDAGRQLAETLGATNRLLQVETAEATVQDRGVVTASEVCQRSESGLLNVEFLQLRFGYEKESPKQPMLVTDEGGRALVGAAADNVALQHIDLSIGAGTKVALVGASGAGKSTLAHLLMRFWDPDQGSVMIEGVDLKHIGLAELRKLVAIVTQDTYLFNDSMRNNLLMAKPEATEQELQQAISKAELTEVVASLEQGLETQVGERGYALSGGQRQRLSIARAFLRDAPILILDEATSHLDALSEAAVNRALAQLMQHRTALVIAHRLASIEDADQIVVLDQGRIIECGNHQELLHKQGVYANLLAYQQGVRAA